MKGSGKGGDPKKNRKKNSKRRGDNAQSQSRSAQGGKQGEGSKKGKKMTIAALIADGRFARKRAGPPVARLKWAPPEPPALDVPQAACILCEKPIKEFATAVCDPTTGKPAHFDCTLSKIAERERLEKGDAVGYIGGGRFGIIHFINPQNPRKFQIKKILEWERNEMRSEWRVALCEHFSTT